jgi:hypothetical protein
LFAQSIYQHLDLQQNVFAVSLALEDLNQNADEVFKAAPTESNEKGGRNSSAR